MSGWWLGGVRARRARRVRRVLVLGLTYACVRVRVLAVAASENVLRHRVDSCEYDMDQLVLGTLLFAIVFFLFPTIAIYYVFFSIVRLMVTLAQATLWWTLSFFHYFPFFAVGRIYLFDRARLPGGVCFQRLGLGLGSPFGRGLSGAGGSGSDGRSDAAANHRPLSFGGEDDFTSFGSGTGSGTDIGGGGGGGDGDASTYLLLQTTPVPLSALFHQYKLVLGTCGVEFAVGWLLAGYGSCEWWWFGCR